MNGTAPKGHDAPIQSEQEDLLNGMVVARAIHRVLATTPRAWSTRIGLFGPWGSGKTSVLNLLRGLEEADDALVVSFSAWSAEGDGGVISQFYAALATKLRTTNLRLPATQRTKSLLAKAQGLRFIGPMVRNGVEQLAPVPPAVTKAIAEGLSKLASSASAWARIAPKDLKALADALGERRVVVFIDDLDRADPKVVPKTLLALRELLDWPGFAFILAFDKRAVASALSDYSSAFGEDAQGFLEKVIDVPFEVPDPSAEQRRRFAEMAFRACCEVMPTTALDGLVASLPAQPRRVKLVARMMGSLRPTLLRHAAEEVDWIALGLFLVIKEASPAAADWVVKAATAERGEWALWAMDEKDRMAKLDEARKELLAVLAAPKLPPDAERVVNAALRLLRHWETTSKATILYLVDLIYRDPVFTRREFEELIRAFNGNQEIASVRSAIRDRSAALRVSENDVATECIKRGIERYVAMLDAMAECETEVEWAVAYVEAERSLLFLETCWAQKGNEIAAASTLGPTVVALLGAVGRWISWTKSDRERHLRERELALTLKATGNCADPDHLFVALDPFWSDRGGSDQVSKDWRKRLRNLLAPRVVTNLCAKFTLSDGLVNVASGDDAVGPWLVENKDSPLYSDPALTNQLVAVLRSGAGEGDSVRVALSKNAKLFLCQLLFQTRDASWGNVDHARAIHQKCPEVIPAAWAALVAVAAPFRARASIRRLRDDLIGIGVEPAQLNEPIWLIDTDAPLSPQPRTN